MYHQLVRVFSTIIVLCLFVAQSNAQVSENQYFIPLTFPKSPNATQFAKYGDYPVNLYSGLPDISIPLYAVESGGLKVPIVLSYHASGLRVNEAASWVGAGWTLSAGGMISRKIEGKPDENGYFNGWEDATKLNPLYNNNDIDYLHGFLIDRNTSQFDTRPDIFSYDIPGHSGKFFFNSKNNYKIETIPFAPLLIQNTAVHFATDTPKFTIQDEHGNKFILGNTARELTASQMDGGGSSQANTGWMLESMISQNRRDTINFTYQVQHIISPYETGQILTVEDMQNTFTNATGCPITYVNPIQPPSPAGTQPVTYEQDISQISFKNGKVEFKLAPRRRLDLDSSGLYKAYSLDTVKFSVYNYAAKKYELQRKVIFHMSYYTGIQGAQGRLRLDSIEIQDKAGAAVQHYRFDYNQQPVPTYISYSKDFWGYYNGKMDDPNITNKTLIPKTQISYLQNNAAGQTPTQIYIGSDDPSSRDPDTTKMQAGILTGIHYPTGGYTTFTYQTNRYYDVSNNLHLTGGLRIVSINSYDGRSPSPIVKTYQYNSSRANFMTSGAGLINYSLFMHTATGRYFGTEGGKPSICFTKQVRSFFSEPSLNLTPTEGNPVAYSNVTEYIGTPSNNVGKSIYVYRDYADQWDGSTGATGIPVVADYFFARGQLASKSDYKKNPDGSYQIVQKQVNTYTALPRGYYDGVGMVVGQSKITDGVISVAYPLLVSGTDDDHDAFPYDNYAIFSGDNYLTNSSTTTYDSSDTTKTATTSVHYQYDDTTHQQIVRTSHTDSKGNTRTTINKYAYNFSAGNAVIDTMVSHNMLAEVIEKQETYTAGANTTTTSAQLSSYKFGNMPGSVVPSTVSVLNISNPVTNFSPASVVSGNLIGDSRYTQMISFDGYDPQNNIAQYTPRNSTPVSILWDYNYELPVAQIKNATNSNYPQVAYTSFEAPRVGGAWYYTGSPVYDVTAPTGQMSYPLTAGSITASSTNFDNSQNYIVSLWSNGGAPSVSAGSSITGTPLRTVNGWTYYEYAVPAGASTITISGTMSIDELRMYPSTAQMTTYAYDPSGLRSITDTKNQVGYFEYDPSQRLKNIKDWNGNIVKNFGYHYYDMVVGNDAIGVTSFTRDNCPAGTSPQSTTYSVPANKYYSSTKTSANAEALYDLKINGQAKADNPAVCGCSATPPQTVTFTLTNSTSTSGFTAAFSGISQPYPFPGPGLSVNIQVPVGSYSVYIGPVGSNTYTFKYGLETQANVHYATFTDVISSTSGGNATTLSVQ